MDLKKELVEIKELAGKTEAGKPVVYVKTHGGLHAFFIGKGASVESIGAAPHKAIAMYMAEKKEPKIKWLEDFIKNEKTEKTLQKSELSFAESFRKVIFSKPKDKPLEYSHSDDYFVYDPKNDQYGVLTKNELTDLAKNKEISRFSIIRKGSLDEPYKFLIDAFGDENVG